MQKIVKKQPKETFTYECDNIIIKWEISSLIMTMSVPMLWSVHVQGSISKDPCKSINVQKRIANEKKIEKKILSWKMNRTFNESETIVFSVHISHFRFRWILQHFASIDWLFFAKNEMMSFFTVFYLFF